MFGHMTETKFTVVDTLTFWMNTGETAKISAGAADELSAGMVASVRPLIGEDQNFDLSVYAF